MSFHAFIFLQILFYVCCFKTHVQKVVHPELLYLFHYLSIIRHVKKGDYRFCPVFLIQSYSCIPKASDHRVLYSARISFQSSELGPNPFSSPLLGPTVGDTLTCGEGVGRPNFDKGTDTLILYVYNIIPQNAPDTDILLMLVSQLCQWHRQEKYIIGF